MLKTNKRRVIYQRVRVLLEGIVEVSKRKKMIILVTITVNKFIRAQLLEEKL